MEETEQNAESIQKRKHRHRKKNLYASILKQMEFYFSDAALSKDRFLGQLVKNDPMVPLEIFLKFNKIKALTDKTTDIAKALQESTKLEVSEDKTRVMRKTPLAAYDIDARTVYVESIPPSAGLQWLTDIFQAYGPVAYIALPKFQQTNRIKGFAFVEFENPQDAEKCLEAFTLMQCKLPTNIRAENLLSCQGSQSNVTDSEEKQLKIDQAEPPDVENEKQTCDEPPAKKSRKRKNSDKLHDRELKTKDDNIPQSVTTPIADSEKLLESGTEQSEEVSEIDTSAAPSEPKKKKLRKRKKKDRKKPNKEREKKGLEGAAQGLQVLSKREWKVLRNQYLTLQRKQFKALKQVLRTRHTVPQQRGAPSTGSVAVHKPPKYVPEVEQPPEAVEAEVPPAIVFTPGVIVRAQLSEPCVNVKEFKRSAKSNIHVKFVDIKEGSFELHLRLDDAVAAQQLSVSGVFSDACVLTGEEEKKYWEKLQRQHGDRIASKHKERGRDRLLHRAMQAAPPNSAQPSGKHIRFDE